MPLDALFCANLRAEREDEVVGSWVRVGKQRYANEAVDEGFDGALDALIDGQRVVLGIDVAVVVEIADDNAVEKGFNAATRKCEKKDLIGAKSVKEQWFIHSIIQSFNHLRILSFIQSFIHFIHSFHSFNLSFISFTCDCHLHVCSQHIFTRNQYILQRPFHRSFAFHQRILRILNTCDRLVDKPQHDFVNVRHAIAQQAILRCQIATYSLKRTLQNAPKIVADLMMTAITVNLLQFHLPFDTSSFSFSSVSS